MRPFTFARLGHVGRLGNQLWQIAGTVGLAARLRGQPVVDETWTYRRWFSIPDSWYGTTAGAADVTRYATHLDRRARPYLQDLRIWQPHAGTIRQAFQPSPAAVAVIQPILASYRAERPGPLLAIHVRRGDYATNPAGTMNSLEPEWYERAIQSVTEHAATSGGCRPISVVFSDDIAWAREHVFADHYHDPPVRTVGQDDADPTDWLDLQLMAGMDLHVIANSTYSWWAAFIGGDPAARYPAYWYGDKIAAYTRADVMMPPDWIRVP